MTGPAEEKQPFGGANDPLYADAVAIVRKHRRGSISLVQRHLRIGYLRAHYMVEAMVGTVLAEMPPTAKLLPEVTANARVQAAAEGGRACNDLLGGTVTTKKGQGHEQSD